MDEEDQAEAEVEWEMAQVPYVMSGVDIANDLY